MASEILYGRSGLATLEQDVPLQGTKEAYVCEGERKLLGRRQTATSQMVRPEQARLALVLPACKTMTQQGERDRESWVCKSKQQWALDWDRCHISCGAVPWAEEWGQDRGSGKVRNLGPGPASEADGKHRTCWTSQAQLQVEEGASS